MGNFHAWNNGTECRTVIVSPDCFETRTEPGLVIKITTRLCDEIIFGPRRLHVILRSPGPARGSLPCFCCSALVASSATDLSVDTRLRPKQLKMVSHFWPFLPEVGSLLERVPISSSYRLNRTHGLGRKIDLQAAEILPHVFGICCAR